MPPYARVMTGPSDRPRSSACSPARTCCSSMSSPWRPWSAAYLLGQWQLGAWKEHRADTGNRLAHEAPRPLDSVIGPDAAFPKDDVGRPVELAGQWLPDRSVYVDGRLQDGRTGFWLVTPIAVCSAGRGLRRAPRPSPSSSAGRPRPRARPHRRGRDDVDRLAPAPRAGRRRRRPTPGRRAPAAAGRRPPRPGRPRPLQRLRDPRPPRRRPRRPRRGHPRLAAQGTGLDRRCATCSTASSGGSSGPSPPSSGGAGAATRSASPRPAQRAAPRPASPLPTPPPGPASRRRAGSGSSATVGRVSSAPAGLPRDGHDRRRPPHRPVPGRPPAQRGAPGRPGLVPRRQRRPAARRRHLEVPRRRPRLALHDLPRRGLHALPPGRAGTSASRVTTLLSGTVPILSFWAERRATRRVQRARRRARWSCPRTGCRPTGGRPGHPRRHPCEVDLLRRRVGRGRLVRRLGRVGGRLVGRSCRRRRRASGAGGSGAAVAAAVADRRGRRRGGGRCGRGGVAPARCGSLLPPQPLGDRGGRGAEAERPRAPS